jgi:hypothetical protein
MDGYPILVFTITVPWPPKMIVKEPATESKQLNILQ